MNYLAHLLLSGPDPRPALGNFLADMLKPGDTNALDPEVLEGVMIHRAIDTYTDAHPMVRRSTARVRPGLRKYAPVAVDVYYDHLLTIAWDRFASISFEKMTTYIYRQFARDIDLVPFRLRPRVSSMVEHRWLSAYGTPEDLADVFRRLSARASHPEFLDQAPEALAEHHKGLEADFQHFFPDLVRHIVAIRQASNPWISLRNGRKG